MTDVLPDYLERADHGPFDGDPARETIEQAHLVAELTLHPGWRILTGRIEEEAERWERRLLDGKIADLNEYIKCANYARGLRHILEVPAALEKAAQDARLQVRPEPEGE